MEECGVVWCRSLACFFSLLCIPGRLLCRVTAVETPGKGDVKDVLEARGSREKGYGARIETPVVWVEERAGVAGNII